jgi:pyridoxamine 5'-phosphate oxidase family protein
MQALKTYEIAYLKSQILGRIATANAAGQPHVTPVGFSYDAETGTIEVGGLDIPATRKARDIQENPKVSFVVDDLESIKPWRPRGITVRGTAVLFEQNGTDGTPFGSTKIRIIPERVVSWGIEAPTFAAH